MAEVGVGKCLSCSICSSLLISLALINVNLSQVAKEVKIISKRSI